METSVRIIATPVTTPVVPAKACLPARQAGTQAFGIDMKVCHHCGGSLRIIAPLLEPHAIKAILTHLRIPDKPPDLAPAHILEQFPFT